MFIINRNTSVMEELDKDRQYRSNQGRSPRQMENNYKIMGWSMLGFIITLLFLFISNLASGQSLTLSLDGGGGGDGLIVNSTLNGEIPIVKGFNVGAGVELKNFNSFQGLVSNRIYLTNQYSLFSGIKYKKIDVREKITDKLQDEYLKLSGYFVYLEYDMDDGPPFIWRRKRICKCWKKASYPILYLGANSYDFNLVNIVAGVRIKLL